LAAETATLAATPAAPAPKAIATPPKPAPKAEPLEVVEAEIVTMGPGAAPAPVKPPPTKRGPKKSKPKPGEI
jgi:hypothetical protein